jgi:hypothetical protein
LEPAAIPDTENHFASGILRSRHENWLYAYIYIYIFLACMIQHVRRESPNGKINNPAAEENEQAAPSAVAIGAIKIICEIVSDYAAIAAGRLSTEANIRVGPQCLKL